MRSLQFPILLPWLLVLGGCSCLTGVSYQPAPLRAPAGIHSPARTSHQASRAAHHVAPALELNAGLTDDRPWAQQSTAPYRSPETAFCFACLIAGGGHFYSGETVKGAALLGAAAGGLIVGSVLSSDGDYGDCEYNPETFECEPSGGRTPLWIGAGVAAASWVYGIIDSRASAKRANARNGQSEGPSLDVRPGLGLSRGQPRAHLAFRASW